MLKKKIQKYCDNNPIILDFDYRDELSKEQIIKILSEPDGLINFENDIYENNLDWIGENEDYFLRNNLYEEFENTLQPIFERIYPEESEEWIETEIKDYLKENFSVSCNLNVDQLLNNTPDLFALIKVYSNYDCTNSFDTIETSDYLKQVFKRVKNGVRKEDFINEHINGAYGGSLFCFAFKTDIKTLIAYKEAIKKAKYVKIPAGTQFGFFSDFSGSGSPFEKVTFQDFKLKVKETTKGFCPKYDCIGLVADIEQSYSMNDVYSPTSDFLSFQNLSFR